MTLRCQIRDRAIWLRARIIHPFLKIACEPIDLKIDTGALSSVIPTRIVDWFVQRGDYLPTVGKLPQNVTLGDNTKVKSFRYLVDLEVFDWNGTTWKVIQNDLRFRFHGVWALPRASALLGYDLLSMCETLTFHGQREEAFLTVPDSLRGHG